MKPNICKYPELEICINKIPVIALIDTGCEISMASSVWFQKNRYRLGHNEMVRLSNTFIKGAACKGGLKHVNQVFLEVTVN